MLVAIVSDTHLPRGKRAIPESCRERLRTSDLIVHAGDLTTMQVLEDLREYGEVRAIHGNADEERVRALLPATTELDLDGRVVVVTHDAGRRIGRLERLRRRYPGAAAVIFGHSHIPLHELADDGFQIFNPGSPTDKRRQPHHTMGIARVTAGRLEFELIVLD